MKCPCVNNPYCRRDVARNVSIGFDMMTWVDPCKPGIDQIPASSVIGPDGTIAPAPAPAPAPGKPAIPWWLIVVGGYLLYKQGTGL